MNLISNKKEVRTLPDRVPKFGHRGGLHRCKDDTHSVDQVSVHGPTRLSRHLVFPAPHLRI